MTEIGVRIQSNMVSVQHAQEGETAVYTSGKHDRVSCVSEAKVRNSFQTVNKQYVDAILSAAQMC